jgi:hypothetical protein
VVVPCKYHENNPVIGADKDVELKRVVPFREVNPPTIVDGKTLDESITHPSGTSNTLES